MTKTILGETGNLMEYYDTGHDGKYSVNATNFLAQTFTPTVDHDLLCLSFLDSYVSPPPFVKVELKHTDAFGKPTGVAIDTAIFSYSHFSKPEASWCVPIFKFWPDLIAGTKYALVWSAPTSAFGEWTEIGADKTAATYTGGELLTSNDGGATWTAHPTEDVIFRNWGYTPIPHPKPPPAISNWLFTNLTWEVYPDGFIITATTATLCHLWMRYTTVEPQQHKIPRSIRGIALPSDKRFCFVAFTDNEQEEKGDTLVHTFIKTPWPVCETRWFYFYGTRGDILIPSTSPIFKLHRKEEDVTDYVFSLGKFGETPHLHGDVKLKEGANIIITRVGADNALEIASTGGEAAPCFGNSWLWWDSDGAVMPIGTISHDYAKLATTRLNQEHRLYTPPQWALGLNQYQRLEFRAIRTSAVAGNPEIRIGIMMNQPNIIGYPVAEGMYFQLAWIYVYCVTANGVARTSTRIADSDLGSPKWLRIDRNAADVKFYWNGALVATHTTNLPTALKTCLFVFQVKGTDTQPRAFAISHPKFDFC